jgi:hypothetical protein
MKIMKKYMLWLAAPLLCILMLASCKKNNEVGTLQPSRAFVPTTIVTTPTGASVKIDWKASLFSGGTGLKYTVDISKTAAFTTIDYSTVTDAVTLTLTDAQLVVGQPYYIRIKANATESTPGSNAYVVTTSSFTMPGVLLSVPNADLSSKSVLLKWLTSPDVTKITITPTGGTAFDVVLTPAEVTAMSKLITGLTPNTAYRADIYAGTRVKGFTTFTTPLYTREITTADNLIDAINAAANNDVIGLADGIYECKDATGILVNMVILQKNITLQGKSGDPAKVKIRFKQIDLKGTGAGFGAKSIGFEGTDGVVVTGTTTGPAPYFLNLIGLNTDADNATFTNINIDGCTVDNVLNAFIRGNRVSATNGFVIGNINVNNSVISNVNAAATLGFNTIELSKVQFAQLNLTNSTFYNFGRALVVATTLLTSGTPVPVVKIDKCTFNSFGGNNMFVLVDANTNFLNTTVTNSIIANIPKVSTGAQGLFRGTGAGSSYAFTNNNLFNAVNVAGATLPISNSSTNVTASANTAIALPWTATDFTVPAGSPLRTASTTGGPIGDPRWVK